MSKRSPVAVAAAPAAGAVAEEGAGVPVEAVVCGAGALAVDAAAAGRLLGPAPAGGAGQAPPRRGAAPPRRAAPTFNPTNTATPPAAAGPHNPHVAPPARTGCDPAPPP